ncbi:Haloacid dehalogenase-like hydrolase [Micromonospora pallida]|uniref:Haloacid dehalogenase-like hydrolase n=1 Tax=Micromonospora pallida TaxID=145854 RepID=A0A1C6RWK5_9ACTN|nr:hypothetical protein [Micromonospora pallida]SCL21587.1 Haloacid dehalogenase-like hydrolase [Micromonospora pallida]
MVSGWLPGSTLGATPTPTVLEACARATLDTHAPNRPLYPDVLDVLRRLRAARIRLVALSDATPQQTLMVGDLAAKDGGAAETGITTLILPRALAHPGRPRLGPLAQLVAAEEDQTIRAGSLEPAD